MAEPNKVPAELRNEVATVTKDITFPAFLGVLRVQDDTLLTRGAGISYKIYDDIERDCHAYGLLQKRKLAVIARPWQVDPASEDPLDKKAADVVRRQLDDMGGPLLDNPGIVPAVSTGFDLVCYNLLDAVLKGFSVGEIMWERMDNEIVARSVRPRDQRRFEFGDDYTLRLKTLQNMLPGETVPPRKFIVHTFGSKDGNPRGLGLGSKLFWPAFFKRNGITFWLTYLDKYASPTSIGKYPAGASDNDKQVLMNALEAIANDAGVTIPSGMEIELLEAKRAGTVSHEQFCRYMDEEMTFAVLGESPTSKGSGGALASAALAREEVRLELVKADADLLSATLNATLSPWITALNVPGARPPKIWRQIKQPEDMKARSERDKNMADIGYRSTLTQVTEDYGGEWEVMPPVGNGVNVAPGKAGPKAGIVPADFAEPGDGFPDQLALDAGVAQLPAEQIQAAMEKALRPVVEYIQAGGDPQEAMAKIAEVFPKMDTRDLQAMLARAIFVAEIWGRLSAEQEVNDGQ